MIYGVGINDVGGDSKPSSEFYRIYDIWHGILRRCYNTHDSVKNASYKETVVCEEWKYYSNFKEWYIQNYVDGYQLDKDIIGGTSDMYSPATCTFVPPIINSCIIDGNRRDKRYPIGVSYMNNDRSIKRYRPTITKYGKQIRNFGLYETAFEAHQVWQREKSLYLEELIEKYKNEVHCDVIRGLQRRVDIIRNNLKNNIETLTISKI